MRVTAIHLYSALDDGVTSFKHAELGLVKPRETDNYILTDIRGLDSDEFNTNSLGERVVGFTIKYQPQYRNDETVDTLRDRLLRMIGFTRHGKIELRFMNDDVHVASLFGTVRKFESDPSTDSPTVEIDFGCRDRILRAPTYTTLTGLVVPDPQFTDNVSTAPHGFVMGIAFTAAVPSPLIIHGVKGVTTADFTIETSFANGDQLWLVSEDENKKLYKISGAVTTQLADRISLGSVWPTIYPGSPTRLDISRYQFTWIEFKHRLAFRGI